MLDEWKKKIAIAFLVKQRIHELDKQNLWEFSYPEIAATENQIRNVEVVLQHALPELYKEFLRCSNGWKTFYQDVDLLGTNELVLEATSGSGTQSLISLRDSGGENLVTIAPNNLLLVGLSREDHAKFFLDISEGYTKGYVYWISNKLVETFPNFSEFFLAMTDYNRLEIADLSRENNL